MSPSVGLGIGMAGATALGSLVGFLYKQRGAAESPPVQASRPVASSLALFRSRWYVLGLGVAMGSWGLHVTALALAPISLVQATIAGGLVLLTAVANLGFGLDVSRREWIGVAVAAVGLAFLAGTLGSTAGGAHAHYAGGDLALYVVALTVGATILAGTSGRGALSPGAALGISAGLLWGLGHHHQGAVGIVVRARGRRTPRPAGPGHPRALPRGPVGLGPLAAGGPGGGGDRRTSARPT